MIVVVVIIIINSIIKQDFYTPSNMFDFAMAAANCPHKMRTATAVRAHNSHICADLA